MTPFLGNRYIMTVANTMSTPSWSMPDAQASGTWSRYGFFSPWLGVNFVKDTEGVVGGPMDS